MTGIYNMSMTINFLLQATRVLQEGNYDEDELVMVTNFITAVDDEILNEYNCTATILSYNNDLELYIEIVDNLIETFEFREDYEICAKLKMMKDKSLEIINKKTI